MSAPRVSEKVVQAQVVKALRLVGARVYVLGTVHAGEPGRMTTRMTAGIGDLLVFLPASPRPGTSGTHTAPHQLWIECKAQGGRLSEAQKGFRDVCHFSGVAYLTGGLEVVLQYLADGGYITAANVPHYRKAGAA